MKTVTLILWACALLCGQAVKLPPHTRQVLPNGAVVVLAPKRDVPLTTVRLVFRGGAEAEPAGKAGLAAITAEVLRRGTATRTAEQINEQLDILGASLGGGADEQSTELFLGFLSKDAGRALDLAGDVLQNPSFPEAEIRKEVSQRSDRLRSVKDNPGAAISYYHPGFFHPVGHPYANPSAGDEASLGRITRDDIQAFYKKMFAGRNLIVVASGDFDGADFGPQVTALAGSLPAGDAYAWVKAPAAPAFPEPRLLLVDKPDATQTYFHIAMPGIHRGHPDRVALRIVNTLFGGRFTSMLNDELRVNSGLTYGADCQVEENRLTGGIYISTYTRTDATEKAIDMAVALLARLRAQGIDAAALASAKAYIKGGFPTSRLETANQVAGVLSEIELFQLGRGEVDDYFSKIDSITLEQANAVAKKYYRTENLQFLLLGAGEKIKSAVARYAPKMKVLPIKDPGFGPVTF